MTMHTDNMNTLVAQNLVNQSMFVRNAPRPIPLILIFQGFRLAETFKRVLVNIINQFKKIFNGSGLVFCPRFQIINYINVKDRLTRGSLSNCLEKSSNSSSVKLIPWPLLRLAIALSGGQNIHPWFLYAKCLLTVHR